MDATSYLLGKKAGGGSGTSNYNDLSNKPSINGVTLSGNKSTSDLGIVIPDISGKQDKIDSTHKLDADLVDDTNSTNKMVSASDKTTWSGKQDALISGTNIKTINNESILGSGNITISGGGGESYVITVEEGSGNALKNYDTAENREVFRQIYDNYANITAKDIIIYETTNNRYFTIDSVKLQSNQLRIIMTYLFTSSQKSLYGVSYNSGLNVQLYTNVNDFSSITLYSLPAYTLVGENFPPLGISNSRSYTPTDNYNPSTKLYTDKTHYENMAGYDATKTQVLKNVNGTLTWITEE